MSKPKTIRLRIDSDMLVEATVDMHGRTLVNLFQDTPFSDGVTMYPHEAERVGKALIAAAERARRMRKGDFR